MIKPKPKKPVRPRNAAASKQLILDAALIEFSTKSFAGARIDEIANRAGVSKPMIYEYFGDKNAIYAAALREAYVQIRRGEDKLNLDGLSPKEAIVSLIVFTMQHYRKNPWFISMLNTENLRRGETVNQVKDLSGIQTSLIAKLKTILEKGHKTGDFRPNVDPVELYIYIASLCYFPISNIHTLRAVFECPIDDAWLDRRSRESAQMIIGFLQPQDDN